VSDTGWDVDDVTVQSCQTPTAVALSSVEASPAAAPLAGLPLAGVALAAGAALAGAVAVRRRR
jgi:hypothetical protein